MIHQTDAFGGVEKTERKKLKRPVVSDRDGMREGGLVICILIFGGMIFAAMLVPGALTSFWVWVALLLMAIGIGSATQRAVAAWHGFQEPEDDAS